MNSHIGQNALNSRRAMALIAGLALLSLALVSAFAYFGVLGSLVVPADPTATLNNLIASDGLFRVGIAAFLVVILLDVVVAWALYVLLRAVNRNLALLMAAFRLAYSVVFLAALASLLDVAQLLGDHGYLASVTTVSLSAQVTASMASFENTWDLSLALFGLHLFALAPLLVRSSLLSKLLAALVLVAGAGYLVDTFGEILVPGYSFSVSVFTFVGEALVIVWLLWTALKGVGRDRALEDDETERWPAQPKAVTA